MTAVSARRLILNADDFGYDPDVTRGIEESMRAGVVSSTTMMVNTPWSEHAAARANGLSIGLHLNLARWTALSEPSHVFDERQVTTLDAGFVEREAEAQLDPGLFVRVHRSHIVAIPHVSFVRKEGDGAIIELDGPTPHRVPVSRAKIAEVKARLGLAARRHAQT